MSFSYKYLRREDAKHFQAAAITVNLTTPHDAIPKHTHNRVVASWIDSGISRHPVPEQSTTKWV